MCGQPQIADHCCGVGRQCAGRTVPGRAARRKSARRCRERTVNPPVSKASVTAWRLRPLGVSRPVSALRSVCRCCAGSIRQSEAYLQHQGSVGRIGHYGLLRTARYRVRRGMNFGRRGADQVIAGRHSDIYGRCWRWRSRCRRALLRVRPDVIVDAPKRLAVWRPSMLYGRRSLVLVHHCHREQWPVAGRMVARHGM